MPRQIALCLYCLILALTTLPFWSLIAEESMTRYTICAVYHRMMVGAMRQKGNLGALADVHMERMNLFLEQAKRSSHEEYGEELGEEIFSDEWAAIQSDMTDQINRNYNNISRLRLRYQVPCKFEP